jgi:hypothetical protein
MNPCQIFKIVLVMFLLTPEILFSQIFGKYLMDPIPSASANASLFKHSRNPATELSDKYFNSDLRISPYRFDIKELTPAEINFQFGLSESHFFNSNFFYIGNNLYNEYSAELGYSTKLSDKILVGIAADYSTINIDRFSSQSAFSVHIGSKLSITDDLDAGFYLRNLLKSSYGSDSLYIWQTAVVGVSYKIMEDAHIDADAIIDITHKSAIALAFKYSVFEFADLRIAWRNSPSFVEAGILLKDIYSLDFVLMTQYNSILGISPMLGMSLTY